MAWPTTDSNGATVLVLGSGGREHALAWKLSSSSKVKTVYVSPGNGADFPIAPISLSDPESICRFCKEEHVDLVVVGPEDYLSRGFVDVIAPTVPCFGPSKEASKLEWSKSFAKNFMNSAEIPTADYQVFTNVSDATEFVQDINWKGIVVKASGLAAGKGVIVCSTQSEAVLAVENMLLEDKFGAAGREIVIEERLYGDELSVLCFTDGSVVKLLPLVQDYKRLYADDEGPNTGGMGVVAPVRIDNETYSVLEQICKRTIKALRERNIIYKGVLYIGAMVTDNGVQVLEYNCRFGDPETEVLMRLLKTDLYEILFACCCGKLGEVQLAYSDDCICGVVLADEGYPFHPRKGSIIKGIFEAEKDDAIVVYQAGTKQEERGLVVNGGRVLCVTAAARTFAEAKSRAYAAIRKIHFDGIYYRADIGNKFVERPLTYCESGVNIDEGNLFVQNIKALCRSLKTTRSDTVGGFSALVDFASLNAGCFGNTQIEIGVDGVGTKLAIADEIQYYETIGQDLLAMCANDVLCHLATPVSFIFYYGFGQRSKNRDVQVLHSIKAACDSIRCTAEGELFCLPELYRKDQWDVAGACIGTRNSQWKRLPLKEEITVGDVLIGIASNGLHSNGYSLVRKIFQNRNLNYRSACPWKKNLSFGQMLLQGTRIYANTLLPALVKFPSVRGAAHITGGGLKENVVRILTNDVKAVIDCNNWQIPAVFKWLHDTGPVSASEMLRTFNCGVGMVLVCSSETASDIMNYLNDSGERTFRIGEIKNRSDGEDQVEFLNTSNFFAGAIYDADSMIIPPSKSSQSAIVQGPAIPGNNELAVRRNICTNVNSLAEDVYNFERRVWYTSDKAANFASSIRFSLFEDEDFGNSELVFTMHGIGAKLTVAETVGGYYENLGQSLVALCADQLLYYGAYPKAFLDYYATGKLCKEKAYEVVEAIAKGCEDVGCALVGGETAEMPGVFQDSQWDIVGVCVGAKNLNLPKLPLTENLSPENVIIGLHCENLRHSGYSFVHKLFSSQELNYRMKCPWEENKTFGEVFLSDVTCYAKRVLPVLLDGHVFSAINVADGLEETIARMLPVNLRAVLDCASWNVPQVFQWLRYTGGHTFEEMMRNFNCGIGMVLVCDAANNDQTLKKLNENGINASVIGKITSREKEEPQVDYVNEFIAFQCWFGKNEPVNIAIMISGTGTNMEELIKSCLSPNNICLISLVISNRADAKGLKVAKKYGIETLVVPFTSAKQRQEFEERVASEIEDRSIDLICLAGFMRILSGEFTERFARRIINVHPALLPSFKGPHPVEDALEAGVKITGCSVHYVTEEVDSGEIIIQEPVPILENDTAEILHRRIQEKEHLLFPYAMHKVAQEIVEKRLAVEAS